MCEPTTHPPPNGSASAGFIRDNYIFCIPCNAFISLEILVTEMESHLQLGNTNLAMRLSRFLEFVRTPHDRLAAKTFSEMARLSHQARVAS